MKEGTPFVLGPHGLSIQQSNWAMEIIGIDQQHGEACRAIVI
jgi:hypothetical protein